MNGTFPFSEGLSPGRSQVTQKSSKEDGRKSRDNIFGQTKIDYEPFRYLTKSPRVIN